MKFTAAKGFSLIELLVVLAILGVLAAIAVPAYSTYRQRANRAEARTALMEAAQSLERYFTRNNRYDTAIIGSIAAGDTIEALTSHRLYRLSFDGSPTQAKYRLRATAQGGQAGDTDCAVMSIDEAGRKTPTECW